MEKYVIKRKQASKNKEKYYEVVITGDANDCNYVTETSTFNQKQFDDIVDELIHLIENHSGNGQMAEYEWDEDDGGELYMYLPRTPWHDYCHTLIDLDITMYDRDGIEYSVHLK